MNPPAPGSEDNSWQAIDIVSDHRATKRYSGRRVNGGANGGGRAPALTSASSVLKKMVKNLSVREYHRDGTLKDEVYSVRELFHYVLEASHRAYTPGSPSHGAPSSFFQRGTGSIRDQQLLEAVHFTVPEGARTPDSVRQAGSVAGSHAGAQRLAALNMMTGCKLQARDLRRLIHSKTDDEVAIHVRKNAVLLNLADWFKAILLWDRLIVLRFVSEEEEDSTVGLLEQESFLDEFEKTLRESELQSTDFVLEGVGTAPLEDPSAADGTQAHVSQGLLEYELVLLDAVLTTLITRLRRAVEVFIPRVRSSLQQLDNSLEVRIMHQNTLRLLKEECLAYDARSRAIVSALEGLLEEESDMSLMCLTRLHFDLAYLLPLHSHHLHGPDLSHEEVEVLIETHRLDVRQAIYKLDMIKNQISASEKLAQSKLDMATNRLLTAGVVFGAGSMCFAFGGFVVGAFGMNLGNGISSEFQVSDYRVFVMVVVFTMIFMVSSTFGIILYLYKSRTLVL